MKFNRLLLVLTTAAFLVPSLAEPTAKGNENITPSNLHSNVSAMSFEDEKALPEANGELSGSEATEMVAHEEGSISSVVTTTSGHHGRRKKTTIGTTGQQNPVTHEGGNATMTSPSLPAISVSNQSEVSFGTIEAQVVDGSPAADDMTTLFTVGHTESTEGDTTTEPTTTEPTTTEPTTTEPTTTELTTTESTTIEPTTTEPTTTEPTTTEPTTTEPTTTEPTTTEPTTTEPTTTEPTTTEPTTTEATTTELTTTEPTTTEPTTTQPTTTQPTTTHTHETTTLADTTVTPVQSTTKHHGDHGQCDHGNNRTCLECTLLDQHCHYSHYDRRCFYHSEIHNEDGYECMNHYSIELEYTQPLVAIIVGVIVSVLYAVGLVCLIICCTPKSEIPPRWQQNYVASNAELSSVKVDPTNEPTAGTAEPSAPTNAPGPSQNRT